MFDDFEVNITNRWSTTFSSDCIPTFGYTSGQDDDELRFYSTGGACGSNPCIATLDYTDGSADFRNTSIISFIVNQGNF